VRIVIIAIAAVLLVAGCQGRQSSTPPAPQQEVEISMSEFKFEPASVEVKPGKVKFHFNNTGAVEHTALIPQLSKGTPMVKPGTDFDVEFDLAPGTYTIVCDVPGHKEAGMQMTLVVK
jgi:plastocyanin